MWGFKNAIWNYLNSTQKQYGRTYSESGHRSLKYEAWGGEICPKKKVKLKSEPRKKDLIKIKREIGG